MILRYFYYVGGAQAYNFLSSILSYSVVTKNNTLWHIEISLVNTGLTSERGVCVALADSAVIMKKRIFFWKEVFESLTAFCCLLKHDVTYTVHPFKVYNSVIFSKFSRS